MNAGRQLLRVGWAAVPRAVLPAQGTRNYTSMERIKELQAMFQKDMDKPVHLLRGRSDRIIMYFMGTSCFGMTMYSFYNFYMVANNKYKPR